ncbi:MAG TPA: hypothetical protein VKG44_00985 [Candidatus Baltobacteraceae bacterium]|nr:hypothetical protein [Candidatus Baltobacteraceae bacterium]
MNAWQALTATVLLALAPTLGAAQTPAAKASPAPREELREIIRVRAVTPFCREVVPAAAAAVQPMLRFDARLARLMADLDSVSWDRSPLHRAQAQKMVEKAAVELRELAGQGRGELADLRRIELDASDGGQIDALDDFTSEIDGARRRQSSMALSLQNLSARISTASLAWGDENDFGFAARASGAGTASAPFTGPTPDPDDPVAGQVYTKYVRDRFWDYLEEEDRIYEQERKAATHMASAFDGCL